MRDYIIVGAGSAGCVLAARLTKDPDVQVTLIEAGAPDTAIDIHIPAAFGKLFQSKWDWHYLTDPEPGLDFRRRYLPRQDAGRLVLDERDDLHPREIRPTTTSGLPMAQPDGAGRTCCPISCAPRTTSVARVSCTAPAAR
jgi:hypothetical protein